MSDDNELRYEELKRRVDYQIEANRHIEEQAGRVIRLVLTTFSILFAGVTVLYTTGALDVLISGIQVQSLESLQSGLESNLSLSLSPDYAVFITSVLVIVYSLFVSASATKFFYDVPINAYNVLTATVMEPSVDFALRDESSLQKAVTEFQTIANKNQKALNTTRGFWEDCYEALKRSVLYGAGAGLFGVVSFIDQTPAIAGITAVTALLVISAFALYFGAKKLPESAVSTFRTYNWPSEVGRGATAIGAYPFALGSFGSTPEVPDHAVLIALLGWILIAMGYKKLELAAVSDLLQRDFISFIGLFFVFAITFSVLSPFLNGTAKYAYGILLAVLFSIIYAFFIGFIYRAIVGAKTVFSRSKVSDRLAKHFVITNAAGCSTMFSSSCRSTATATISRLTGSSSSISGIGSSRLSTAC